MSGDQYHLPSIEAAGALAALSAGRVLLVDVRKPDAVARSGRAIAGAVQRDPFTLGHRDPLTRSRRVIVTFCVHGHEVSRFACALLLLHGVDARYVAGGYEALVAAGAATRPLDAMEGEG